MPDSPAPAYPLVALLYQLLPARGVHWQLALAPDASPTEPFAALTPEGDLIARFELTVFDPDDATQMLDMKQQEFCVLPAAYTRDAERAAAFLRAWTQSVPAIAAALTDDPAMLMPVDLVPLLALDDTRLQTEADFVAALSDASRVRAWQQEEQVAEVREVMRGWGAEDKAEEFLALRRPAIRFADHVRVGAEGEGDAGGEEEAVEFGGQTRFGGEPDLPAGVAWPVHGGKPMTFVAQLDLAALAGFTAAGELPSDGMLSFFYEALPEPDARGHHEHAVRVMHLPPGVKLARRATPAGGDRRPEFRASPTELVDSLPPGESPFYEALLPDERVMAYRRAIDAAGRGESVRVVDPMPGLAALVQQWGDPDSFEDETHRVLGYCTPHQGDPYLQAEVDAAGVGFDGLDEGAAEAVRTRRAARRWRLLLQVCAMVEGELLLEQDAGYVYFLVPEEALRAQDWRQVRCVMQCS